MLPLEFPYDATRIMHGPRITVTVSVVRIAEGEVIVVKKCEWCGREQVWCGDRTGDVRTFSEKQPRGRGFVSDAG